MSLLNAQQLERVSHAVNDLTPAQLAWVGGYLSGLSLGAGSSNIIPFPQLAGVPAAQPVAAVTTTILYGSQTGNSKGVAEKLLAALEQAGHQVSLASLRDYRPQQLKKEQRVVFVLSTQGNGEPPDDARAFFQFINSQRAPKLDGVDFAVLALGDSAYEEFCQTGRELDQRLAELGANRWLARIDCDVDFADSAAQWRDQVVAKLAQESASQQGSVTPLRANTLSTAVQQAGLGTVDAPYSAEVLAVVPVTDVDSTKEVFHLELSLEDSGIQYQPGDILGVLIQNDRVLVDALLAQLELDGTVSVQLKGQSINLRDALLDKLEITSLTRRQLQAYAEASQQTVLLQQLAEQAEDADWLAGADWLDVLQTYPATLTAQSFVDLLRPLKAREYSIASSPQAHEDEVHLLVKRVRYAHQQREHFGAGSNWLARLQAGESAQIWIRSNDHFRLPGQDDTRIIMIGAGTGVAPFRSFIAERDIRGAQGNSWLFFGEQHFRSDFLYQAEWLNYLKTGALEKMSVAFSRDQAERIYVQHRLLEQGAEVWTWLQDGAHLYVCGDMQRMAKDVHAALIQIGVEQGHYNAEQAEQWLEQLISDKRYQRDVY